ncbi:hypothetical protein KJ742_04400 [Patescibacteria group bacterium]|nr:hypothetical protein [Patescibacteria group bacterium]MBU1683159.1 hypothetical protein [Patescibacteria group bacterium]MBU1934522.1 hypothetical protein [Patescibacteria group bacterium]
MGNTELDPQLLADSETSLQQVLNERRDANMGTENLMELVRSAIDVLCCREDAPNGIRRVRMALAQMDIDNMESVAKRED